MSQTPEQRVKSKVRDLLRAVGAWYTTPIAGPYSRAGVPDFLACHAGRFIGIECKAGRGKTTPLQEKELAAIRKTGGVTFVINEKNIEELRAFFGLPSKERL
jgi:Holliday junction resolvase